MPFVGIEVDWNNVGILIKVILHTFAKCCGSTTVRFYKIKIGKIGKQWMVINYDLFLTMLKDIFSLTIIR